MSGKAKIWKPEEDAVIIKMRLEGAIWADIAKVLGLSRNTVIERGRRINAKMPSKAELAAKKQAEKESMPVVSRHINREPLRAGHPLFWQMLCPNDEYPFTSI